MLGMALALLVAQPAPPPATREAPAAQASQGWIAQFDELWKRRDAPGAEKELQQIVEQQLKVEPQSFDANWRFASLYNWKANAIGLGGDDKAAFGRKAWDAAEKAVAARPNDVRGQYDAAVGIGLYSEGVGIITALSQGLEGKFRQHIQAALRLDPNYLDGAPQVVWGRYFFKLPWPKRDEGKAKQILTQVVREHPRNSRAKLYLADCFADEDDVDQGKKLVQLILAGPGGDDQPDERRLKVQAKNWLEAHGPPNTAY